MQISFFYLRGFALVGFFLLFSQTQSASAINTRETLEKAPPSFLLDGENRAVFTDFRDARYQMVYDLENRKASVLATISFATLQEGMPIFDVVAEPVAALLDGEAVKQKLVKVPGGATKVRVLEAVVAPGLHRMSIQVALPDDNSKFSQGQVSSAFWFNDLDDRQFLEMYMPSNLEYDNFKMQFAIEIRGMVEDHMIFSNGKVKRLDNNMFIIDFPAHFTTNSPFFHMGPSDSFDVEVRQFASVKGNNIPVVVYGKRDQQVDLVQYADSAEATLRELEGTYGAFPHESLTVYASPTFGGGMEYCGATITNLWALPHEITHSYFGRGLMPASGDAGWIDEALASWRDKGYQRLDDPGYDSVNMAARSPYIRWTPRTAYSQGAQFMAYLDGLLADGGRTGLKEFLKHMLKTRLFDPISTPNFQKEVQSFLGKSLADEFDRYIYGKSDFRISPIGDEEHSSFETIFEENPFHKRHSLRELRELL